MLPSRFFDYFLDEENENNKMKCDIYEKEGKMFIEMDVPGYDKKDIHIECNKGNITITAEKEEVEKENKKYLRKERKIYGKFQRSFYFDDVDEDSIEAEFKDGLLKISLAKRNQEENKKLIEIK